MEQKLKIKQEAWKFYKDLVIEQLQINSLKNMLKMRLDNKIDLLVV